MSKISGMSERCTNVNKIKFGNVVKNVQEDPFI